MRVQVSTDRKPAIIGRRKNCGVCFSSIHPVKVLVHKIHSWYTNCFVEFPNRRYLMWTEMQQLCCRSPITQCGLAGAWTKFYAISESTGRYQWYWSNKIRTLYFTNPSEMRFEVLPMVNSHVFDLYSQLGRTFWTNLLPPWHPTPKDCKRNQR